MATFNYTVDTYPMAAEIKSVSGHVNGTTTAVVAMQTAVVLAESKAADHVCDNVNRGFFTMMRSQISQKIAKLQSEVDSHMMKLNQLKKGLLAIKGRMERDYNMTSNRYLKLFNGLNANLKQRVFELDKPVINFAVKDVEQISNRSKYLTATVPITQLESLSTSQKIIASNVKFRGLSVIKSMKVFLSDMTEQKKMTSKILLGTFDIKGATFSLPVLIHECNHDKYDSKSIEITLGNKELDNLTKSEIRNTIFSSVENLKWQYSKEIDKEIKSEFSRLISDSLYSHRIKEMASKLFSANSFDII